MERHLEVCSCLSSFVAGIERESSPARPLTGLRWAGEPPVTAERSPTASLGAAVGVSTSPAGAVKRCVRSGGPGTRREASRSPLPVFRSLADVCGPKNDFFSVFVLLSHFRVVIAGAAVPRGGDASSAWHNPCWRCTTFAVGGEPVRPARGAGVWTKPGAGCVLAEAWLPARARRACRRSRTKDTISSCSILPCGSFRSEFSTDDRPHAGLRKLSLGNRGLHSGGHRPR